MACPDWWFSDELISLMTDITLSLHVRQTYALAGNNFSHGTMLSSTPPLYISGRLLGHTNTVPGWKAGLVSLNMHVYFHYGSS